MSTNIYQIASQKKLRISTSKGSLSVEQLWDLDIEELDSLAVVLEENSKTTNRKSFIKTTVSKEDIIAKLKFDIVLDILTVKELDRQIVLQSKENKAHNEKILYMIEKKKEGAMEEMTVEQLEALLK